MKKTQNDRTIGIERMDETSFEIHDDEKMFFITVENQQNTRTPIFISEKVLTLRQAALVAYVTLDILQIVEPGKAEIDHHAANAIRGYLRTIIEE